VIEAGRRCRLGEGPYWSVHQQALYWVDILDRTVFRLQPTDGTVATWQLPEMIAWLVRCLRSPTTSTKRAAIRTDRLNTLNSPVIGARQLLSHVDLSSDAQLFEVSGVRKHPVALFTRRFDEYTQVL